MSTPKNTPRMENSLLLAILHEDEDEFDKAIMGLNALSFDYPTPLILQALKQWDTLFMIKLQNGLTIKPDQWVDSDVWRLVLLEGSPDQLSCILAFSEGCDWPIIDGNLAMHFMMLRRESSSEKEEMIKMMKAYM